MERGDSKESRKRRFAGPLRGLKKGSCFTLLKGAAADRRDHLCALPFPKNRIASKKIKRTNATKRSSRILQVKPAAGISWRKSPGEELGRAAPEGKRGGYHKLRRGAVGGGGKKWGLRGFRLRRHRRAQASGNASSLPICRGRSHRRRRKSQKPRKKMKSGRRQWGGWGADQSSRHAGWCKNLASCAQQKVSASEGKNSLE